MSFACRSQLLLRGFAESALLCHHCLFPTRSCGFISLLCSRDLLLRRLQGCPRRCCARVLPVRSPLVARPQPFSGWPRPHWPCRNFFAALQFPDAARLRACFGVTTVLLRQQLTLYYNSSTLTTESEILPCFSRIMHMQPRLCCQTFATSSHPYVSTGRVTGHFVCTAMLSCSNANDRRPALVTSRKVSWTFF